MHQKVDRKVSSQETNDMAAGERILGRKLARELSHKELTEVFGGHTPTNGGTCSNGVDCDVAI